MKLLSIIIISFNTERLLKNCIDSVYNSKFEFEFEIIVIDNASEDNSINTIKQNYPDIRLIENSENRLFAKANNQGARIANGKYLLLLNSDTIILVGEIEKLINFIEQNQINIACVGPTILNMDGTIQSNGFALPSISERISMVFKLNKIIPSSIGRYILPKGLPGIIKGNHEVGWVGGCCMLIRSDIYNEIGGLNEELQFYGEEPEFGWRLKQRAYKTWVVSDSFIIHLGGQSSKIPQAGFLNDIEARLFGYSQLQKYTVGYRRAVTMSRIVLFSIKLKKLIVNNPDAKRFLNDAIHYEKLVIKYLKEQYIKYKTTENPSFRY